MMGFSLKMLFHGKKEAFRVILIMTFTTLSIMVLFYMFGNKYINSTVYEASFDFLLRASMILLIVIVCGTLVVSAARYYNQVHSKLIGVIELMGYNIIQTYLFLMIQMVCMILISFVFSVLLSFLVIPLINLFIYSYMEINANIFEFSIPVYCRSLIMVFVLITVTAFMEAEYVMQTPLVQLMKDDLSKSIQKIQTKRFLNIFYIFLSAMGILFVACEPLSQGKTIPSIFYAFGIYGITKQVIPCMIANKRRNTDMDGKASIMYANVVLILREMSGLIFLHMLSLGVIHSLIYANSRQSQYFLQFQVVYVICHFVLTYTYVSRMKLRQFNRSYYYMNLYKLGLTKNEILHLSKREVHIFCIILVFLEMLFFVAISVGCLLRGEISLMMELFMFVEYIGFVIVCWITMTYDVKRSVETWKK